MVGASFTTTYNGISRELQSDVHVMATNVQDNNADREWKALWDTGATCSVITKEVVNALGLRPVSKQTAYTPAGKYEAYCYLINLGLPNKVLIPNLLVMEGQLSADSNMLIGMDVISKGDFAVTNYEGKTTFTFRIPSCCTLDFVERTYLQPVQKEKQPGRNDMCPCGSGKKYKYCHGKN